MPSGFTSKSVSLPPIACEAVKRKARLTARAIDSDAEELSVFELELVIHRRILLNSILQF